jgi:hypothetical protein
MDLLLSDAGSHQFPEHVLEAVNNTVCHYFFDTSEKVYLKSQISDLKVDPRSIENSVHMCTGALVH